MALDRSAPDAPASPDPKPAVRSNPDPVGSKSDSVVQSNPDSVVQSNPDSVVRSNEVLSIFFPMWNEEAYVERAISAAKAICDQMVDTGVIGDYELIIVDDKSTDHTPEIADALALADARVRVVHHEVNRKLGGSIKTGFASARGDLVLYSDADLPFDFLEVPRAIRLLRQYEADLLSAYRFDRTGEGYARAVYTFFYNLLVRTMFGVKARDINFAFKMCRRRVLEGLELRSEGSFIDAELIIRATRSGFELLQFGVDYFPRTRGESTLSSFRVITTIIKEMFQLRGELEALKTGPKALGATGQNDGSAATDIP